MKNVNFIIKSLKVLKKTKFLVITTSLFLYFPLNAFSESRIYNLEIKNEVVNITGVPVDFALQVIDQDASGGLANGSLGIPGPTLRFTEGDEAIINVKNSTSEETSIHWHGLLVPWNMDGVPGLNSPSIKAGTSFTFRFPIRQNGTYWYHSHTSLQEQRGVYGSIVIEPRTKSIDIDYDVVLVLSDWINENPMQVMENLKKDGDYYAWKKKTIPNYIDAIKEGSLKDYLRNQWNRMDGMDLSDIGYDAFLINGKSKSEILPQLKKGDRVRLRLINAGASSYFHVNIGKQAFTVLSSDGIDVQPVMTKEILMGMAETYDILFTVPESNVAYEFRSTAQDITGFASVTLGKGHHTEMAPMKVKPSIYKMGMDGMDHGGGNGGEGGGGGEHDGHGMMSNHEMLPMSGGMNHSEMDHTRKSGMDDDGDGFDDDFDDDIMPDMTMPLKYAQLKAKTKTSFSADRPVMEFKLNLTGDMSRYVWSINGKLLSEDTYINIEEGSVIRFILDNKTMMHHPMHLHGHFFRVLNGQGDFAPLKHTVDVQPMQSVTIEFLANEPGEWFFHCHNLYHMKSGMARVVRYTNFVRPTEIAETSTTPIKEFKMMDSKMTPSAELGVFSNGATWDIKFNGGRYEVAIEGEITEYDRKKIESEIYVRHYLSNYFNVFGGLELDNEKLSPIAGISYVIPLNFELISYVNSKGDLVFKVEKTVQISQRIFVDLDAKKRFAGASNESDENQYGFGLNYQLNQRVSFGARYIKSDDLDDYYGIGIRVKF